MQKALAEIHHRSKRRLFKFDVLDLDTDLILTNMWVKDFKPTMATEDGLKALKAYASQHAKAVHVIARSNKVFNILHMHGFTFNPMFTGKGDISQYLPKDLVYLYSWRHYSNGLKTDSKTDSAQT